MKALLKKQSQDDFLVLTDIKKPQPKNDEILIKIHAAGICGSDIHIMNNEYPSNPPVVLGHEYSGTVSEIGKDVSNFTTGDRVVSLTAIETCGSCIYCRQGLRMLCPERKSIGSGRNGAFTEFITVPSDLAFKIPDKISLDEAVLCEPLACVVRSVLERGCVKAGDYVYISGPGIIGQIAAQLAALSGAYVVVGGMSHDKERLLLARENGAINQIIVDSEDVLTKAMKFTNERGFDVAFECSGAQASSHICLNVLKKTGIYSQLGLFGRSIDFNMDLALIKEINFSNSYASEWTSWDRALSLLDQGKVNLSSLIGPKFKLSEWREAFNLMLRREGYKILLISE